MVSSVHIGYKKKDILVLDKDSTQGLDNNTLTPDKEEQPKTICLRFILK